MGIVHVCCGGACACVRMPVCMRSYVCYGMDVCVRARVCGCACQVVGWLGGCVGGYVFVLSACKAGVHRFNSYFSVLLCGRRESARVLTHVWAPSSVKTSQTYISYESVQQRAVACVFARYWAVVPGNFVYRTCETIA